MFSITVPSPSVSISTSTNSSSLVEGQFLDIVCNVNISEAINTGINVSITWQKNGGSALTNNTDYTISPLTSVSNMYTSTLRIESLNHDGSDPDNGAVYSCSVTVQPSPVSPFITGNSNSDSITLTVAGMVIVYCIVLYIYYRFQY